MVIVTGSKQSGTALWMQILIAAGHDGLIDPSLRHGVYFATNPHPVTAEYLFPEQVTRHVLEMFPFGVTRTDRAYIGHVVATLRPLREYVAAMRRLYALEDAGREGSCPVRLDPALEWWAETYALLRDVSIRRYPVHFETLDHLLRDPEQVIAEVVGWLGTGDASRAADTVKPERRQFEGTEDISLGPDIATVCDELYGVMDARQPVSDALLSKLNETQRILLPRLKDEDARVAARAR